MRVQAIVLIICAGLILSCGQSRQKESSAEQTVTATKNTRAGKRKVRIDTAVVWVEVADRDELRQRGLMFRTELPEDEGMLFVFERPEIQSFWMRNTYIPLDIAFIDEKGRITDIYQMKPLDEEPRYESSVPVPFAIELNQGWFAKRGIKVGAQVSYD
ncbi:MAG: DUF192 domain-containing protein [Chloroherpetonaceae bacterium]|nr:DUF192 domain-containing protein [Chloroherpetonaceae bacterium]MCS7210595.1 DUF192 domain-containing protein [Chloroherpetonaceae bacterium]MDW8018931.1 DUF192 domain-containing protein [Chloroherpetonaceae bacterium]MDW8465042.1 DUF192 domain-containing protein [Chloroherpetonaceae bacterium]